jgi:quinoprotein glucose dehydrogenase
MKKYRIGPMYTPPSLRGTLTLPGALGGANWGGGAFDVETGILYVKSSNSPHVARLQRPERSDSKPQPAQSVLGQNVNAYLGAPSKYPTDAEWVLGDGRAQFMGGLPLLKPPYGTLTAIDLNRGDIAWRVVLGDTLSLRQHPSLKGLQLPDQFGATGPPGAIVTGGGLVFVGGGDAAFHAFDKATGRELWRNPLPQRSTGTPMTYRTRSGRQFVVIATGSGKDGTLVAFALAGSARR